MTTTPLDAARVKEIEDYVRGGWQENSGADFSRMVFDLLADRAHREQIIGGAFAKSDQGRSMFRRIAELEQQIAALKHTPVSSNTEVEEVNQVFSGLCWQPIETAPKDKFIMLWCDEDRSTWLAKWQGGEWFGTDDQGLRRTGNDPSGGVTGWFPTLWCEVPKPNPSVPPLIREEGGET